MQIAGKKIVVVGLGKSGIAAAKFCAQRGAIVVATDKKPEAEIGEGLSGLRSLGVRLVLGCHDKKDFLSADAVIVSPGVPLNMDGLEEAGAKGTTIVGEMELASIELDKPIIAITGTNGKTTTTSLVSHLLALANIPHVTGGNIGTPALELLETAKKSSFAVLEVSSFQIDTSPSLRPFVSVFLNITPDHLDRHHTLADYVSSKAALFDRTQAQGFGIYNAADDAVAQSVLSAPCRLIPFDATGRFITKDSSGPKAFFDGSSMVVDKSGTGGNFYPIADLPLRGVHNRENMLAAAMTAEICGAAQSDVMQGLLSFRGLPHRIEFVGEWNGVSYYDDSKGTNVGATASALEQFAQPVVLIAGGLSKGVDFSPLKNSVSAHVKTLVLIGEAAGLMEKTFAGCAKIVRANSMDEAVGISSAEAMPGDVVLLSPACASFDMFKDYADRGRSFARAVKKLNGVLAPVEKAL